MAGPTMPTSSNPLSTPTQSANGLATMNNLSTPLNASGQVPGTPGTGAGGGTPAGVLPSSKTWELSDYELNRLPQEAITDGSEIAVSPRALHSELMCPICLDMLHNTMTTKECLHRFCSECIITALRSGNKECPTCRKKLVSKRSLRHDPNFDQLISKIYPSRDEYEQQQQKTLAKLTKTHTQLALATSIEEGMKQQLQKKQLEAIQKQQQQQLGATGTAKPSATSTITTLELKNGTPIPTSLNPQRPTTPSIESSAAAAAIGAGALMIPAPNGHPPTPSGAITVHETTPGPQSVSVSIPGDSSSSSSGYSEEVTEVELVFKPHPDMLSSPASTATVQNQTRYIKTTANASVEHLAKYLGMRLALDSTTDASTAASTLHNCTIWISPSGAQGDFVMIPQTQTLASVCEKYWKFNKPLEMYYSWKKI